MKRVFTKLYVYTLLALQFGALLYLVLTGPILAPTMPLFLLQIGGLLLGWAALWRMSGTPWQASPELHPRARLITKGIYKRIRHPMYATLLIFALSWLYAEYSLERLWVALILFCALLLKMYFEERALRQRFGSSYEAYCRRTKRIVPMIF